MAKLVVHGAMLRCSQGTSPSTLSVLPAVFTTAGEMRAATIMDQKPMVNIAPFGMCQTQANPQVAAATSAANGVLTPQPCIPVIAAPWSPGASVVGLPELKALTDDSKCTCQWTGSIEIVTPGSIIEVK
ncbi:DUF4280 domain-containing protein [Polyangium sp. y55x31]|uniref:DUF4280 domain-containing protein n=1 Tax=Polyangium sp. y55x31 TaxID=3042688 RepID=UPI0024829609|nr:DUF4280 domain-containing protein [Polyangium sp. y55x31]MDI1478930.1 DUF4280 domain-containing protein [Polyangium sp. y55x31]